MKAFDKFYIDNKNNLFAYLMRMTGDYYLSSDIMQESFTRILKRYSSEDWNKALLFSIARNAVIDEKRKRPDGKTYEFNENTGADDPEHMLQVRETYRNVLKAMQLLEPQEKDILALKVSSGLSYREISAIAGISVANVKVKIHRARTKLKSILNSEDKK